MNNKKDLKFITCCPDDTYYTWQVHLWLESLKKLNKSQDAIVLLFVPFGRKPNEKWKKIFELFPETEFKTYQDNTDQISTIYIPQYIPILRPYVMWRYFTENPDMVNKAIFYCDSDILFLDNFNVDKFVDDDINYLSNTNSYINVDYFDNKWKDAVVEKQQEFKNMDIITMLGSLIGITREEAVAFKDHSGGAQYLLKNINADFWFKIMRDCIIIRSYLNKLNQDFFESESKGFQSWCADMWAVLWNIWAKKQFTQVIPEMNFAWSTDSIERLKTNTILHNAGITNKIMGDFPAFYKGAYHTGQDPTKDPHLKIVLNNNITKTKCNWFYANELKKLKEKYNINY